MKKLSSNAGDVLLELEQFVLHAANHWEFHWTLIREGTYDRNLQVFNHWLFWYGSIREASLTAAITNISKYFETNRSTVNIRYLVEMLGAETEDWSTEIARMQQLLIECERTAKDVTILRSNLYVHKSRKLSFEETYKLTKSKYDDVSVMIDKMADCLSVVSLALGAQGVVVAGVREKVSTELEDVLDRLRVAVS